MTSISSRFLSDCPQQASLAESIYISDGWKRIQVRMVCEPCNELETARLGAVESVRAFIS
jgi:hypothetical protein